VNPAAVGALPDREDFAANLPEPGMGDGFRNFTRDGPLIGFPGFRVSHPRQDKDSASTISPLSKRFAIRGRIISSALSVYTTTATYP